MVLVKGFSDTLVRSVFVDFYGSVCAYCRRRSPCMMVVDHIDPVCIGGSDSLLNYCLACQECNGTGYKGGSKLEEPGRSLLLTMARRNESEILKILKNRQQAASRYSTIQQKLNGSNVHNLPDGIKLIFPKKGEPRDAWFVYQQLADNGFLPGSLYRHDHISRGYHYRDVVLDHNTLCAFLTFSNFNHMRFREACKYLSQTFVLDVDRRRKVLNDYVFLNRNEKKILEKNTLTRIFRVEARFLINQQLVRNYHHLVRKPLERIPFSTY